MKTLIGIIIIAASIFISGFAFAGNYELIEVKNISFDDPTYGIINRFMIKVVVKNNPVTKKQIKALSEEIIEYCREIADDIIILYYFDSSQTGGIYTLASVEWAVDTETTYKFTGVVDKKRTNEPTKLEREINDAMKALWIERAEAYNAITDRETAKILAPNYGKTVKEMLKIRYKVGGYDLGLTQ